MINPKASSIARDAERPGERVDIDGTEFFEAVVEPFWMRLKKPVGVEFSGVCDSPRSKVLSPSPARWCGRECSW